MPAERVAVFSLLARLVTIARVLESKFDAEALSASSPVCLASMTSNSLLAAWVSLAVASRLLLITACWPVVIASRVS